jgi:hypothetical protein
MENGEVIEKEYYYFRIILGDIVLATGLADSMQEVAFKATVAEHDLKVLEPLCC